MDNIKMEQALRYPQISVIIAAYQSGDMLLQALDSVLIQDYPRIQVIICDDGSENFCEASLIQRFNASKRGEYSFHIVHQNQNIGTVRNLNSGLELATGEWLLFLAADDVLASPDVISKLYTASVHSQELWLISRTVECSDNFCKHNTLSPSNAVIDYIRHADANKIFARLCRDCFLPSSGTFYRRKFFVLMGSFDESYRLVEDWPLYLKVIRLNFLPGICNIVSVLHREGGVSGKKAAKNKDYQRDLITVMEREILPNLSFLPMSERNSILELCNDKLDVYSFRFMCTGKIEKLKWCISHLGVIFRRYFRR